MRYDVLENIKPTDEESLDNLGQLFNAYMGRLSMLEASAVPRESMREFRRLWSHGVVTPRLTKRERGQQKNLDKLIPQFYHLQILSNSLHDLHRYVNGAIEKLTEFFDLYHGDLHHFAIENRLRLLAIDGSDDESDWYREDETDDSPEAWKVVRKEDEQSLAPYTLREELGYYFGTSDWRGEHIGDSSVEDFACYTQMVSRSSGFSPFKAIAKFTGKELPIYHENEAGEMVPQTAADRVESEVNDELRDVRVACYFDQILHRLTRAAKVYASAKTSEDYHTLLGQLESIRDCGGLMEPANPFND